MRQTSVIDLEQVQIRLAKTVLMNNSQMVYNLNYRLRVLRCEILAKRPFMSFYWSAQCDFGIGLVCLWIGICSTSELRKVLQMSGVMVFQ